MDQEMRNCNARKVQKTNIEKYNIWRAQKDKYYMDNKL